MIDKIKKVFKIKKLGTPLNIKLLDKTTDSIKIFYDYKIRLKDKKLFVKIFEADKKTLDEFEYYFNELIEQKFETILNPLGVYRDTDILIIITPYIQKNSINMYTEFNNNDKLFINSCIVKIDKLIEETSSKLDINKFVDYNTSQIQTIIKSLLEKANDKELFFIKYYLDIVNKENKEIVTIEEFMPDYLYIYKNQLNIVCIHLTKLKEIQKYDSFFYYYFIFNMYKNDKYKFEYNYFRSSIDEYIKDFNFDYLKYFIGYLLIKSHEFSYELHTNPDNKVYEFDADQEYLINTSLKLKKVITELIFKFEPYLKREKIHALFND